MSTIVDRGPHIADDLPVALVKPTIAVPSLLVFAVAVSTLAIEVVRAVTALIRSGMVAAGRKRTGCPDIRNLNLTTLLCRLMRASLTGCSATAERLPASITNDHRATVSLSGRDRHLEYCKSNRMIAWHRMFTPLPLCLSI